MSSAGGNTGSGNGRANGANGVSHATPAGGGYDKGIDVIEKGGEPTASLTAASASGSAASPVADTASQLGSPAGDASVASTGPAPQKANPGNLAAASAGQAGRRSHRLIALGLFAGSLIVLLASANIGVARDEGYYFEAGERYWRYIAQFGENIAKGKPRLSLTQKAIQDGFGFNHEHPILMKTLFGISWRVFHRCHCAEQRGLHPITYEKKHRTLGLMSEVTAFRFPTMVMTAALIVMVFFFGVELGGAQGTLVGLVAALLTLLQPRLFYNAHLACFDAPIAVMWFAVAYGWWRALTSWRWGLATGVLYGLMLATKHNAWIIPAALGLHWIILRAKAIRQLGARTFLPPLALISSLVLGPAIFILHWPWIWTQTWPRFKEYANFHIHHVHYKMEYLGVNYNGPPYPWHYPLGMTLFTAPVVLLFLALVGAAVFMRRRSHDATQPPSIRSTPRAIMLTPGLGLDRMAGTFIGLNILVSVGTFMTRKTPIFGATKHWLTAMPFVALLAGVGLGRLIELSRDWLALRGRGPGPTRAPSSGRQSLWVATLVACSILPAGVEVYRSHPYQLSYYNALAGGFAGGADLGLNRQFWGYSTRGLLAWLNQNVEPNASVYFHDTNYESYLAYVRDGLLRRDIRWSGFEEPGVRGSRYAMVIHEKHWGKIEAMIWDVYGTTTPVFVLTADGVPLVTLYKRP